VKAALNLANVEPACPVHIVEDNPRSGPNQRVDLRTTVERRSKDLFLWLEVQ
jgi:hypothetical protein